MPDDNKAIKERFVSAVFAGDFETLRLLLHPGFCMAQAEQLPYGGVYEGPEGFIAFLTRFSALLDVERLEGTEIFVAEDGALVEQYAIRATLKADGRRIDTTMLEKWEFEDGKVIRISPHYFDTSFR